MPNKPKLFAWSDAPGLCNTGFSRVAQNLYQDLHKDFEVSILGINYHGLEDYNTEKYFIYPIDNTDPFGYNRFPHVINKLKPDIVLLFQDIFNIIPAVDIVRKVLGPNIPIVSYYPIDGAPVNYSWKKAYSKNYINKHITYSNWAIEEIKNTFPEETKDLDIDILYHGVDPDIYYPLKKFHIKQIKREQGWKDKFVVINLNRYQPRKGIDRTVQAFAMFKYGYYIDKDGNWFPRTFTRHPLQYLTMDDIVDEVPGHDDVAMYAHLMPFERIFGPGKSCSFFAQMRHNGIKDDALGDHFFIPPRDIMSQPYTEEQVNELYNAADVNITGAGGEGCGLSLIESASTGTTSIAPYNSAIPEMIGDTGHLCKNITTYIQALDNSHLRPLVDIRELVKSLEIEYQKWLSNDKKKCFNQAAVDRCDKLFRWEDKRNKLRNILLEHVK